MILYSWGELIVVKDKWFWELTQLVCDQQSVAVVGTTVTQSNHSSRYTPKVQRVRAGIKQYSNVQYAKESKVGSKVMLMSVL